MPDRGRLAWLGDRPFAHRGLHGGAGGPPENSLGAFEGAVAAGYGIELDVQLSLDGVPMVFHDATLERLTGLRGPLAGHPAAALARARIAGSDQGLPRLAQALDLVAGRVPLLIEIKNRRKFRAGPLEAAVWELTRDYAGPFAILSFSPVSLGWFRRRAPEVLRGLNTHKPNRARRLIAGPHFICHEIEGLSHRAAARVRARGLPLLAWTVTSERLRHKAERHADGYIFEHIRP